MAFSLTWRSSDNPLKGILFHPSAIIGLFFREKKNNIARCRIKGRKEWKKYIYKSSGKERKMANGERRRMNENVFRVFKLALRRREREMES